MHEDLVVASDGGRECGISGGVAAVANGVWSCMKTYRWPAMVGEVADLVVASDVWRE